MQSLQRIYRKAEFEFPEENIPLSPKDPTPSRPKWSYGVNNSARNDLDTESRGSRHAYIVKRPRALHYKRIDEPSTQNDIPLTRRTSTALPVNNNRANNKEKDSHSTDDLLKQISRLDLFIDLVWVGIVANLSRAFSEQAFTESGINIGPALLQFVLSFIPIWRIWDNLRGFCINFYVDDILQRTFLAWILLLSVLYGINAPYAYVPGDEGGNSLRILIGIYLVTRGSFLCAGAIQAIYIPFLRRQFLFRLSATFVSAALWIAAIYVKYPAKIGLLVAANFVEHPVDIFLASPVADAYLTPGWKRVTHIDHYVDRHEGFFIIILGEGVFRLIEGSPSGWGLNRQTGTVTAALLMYYLLHFFYFNGDTKQFVHALRRTWWKPVLWQGLHVFMFSSLLILAASSLFLVEHDGWANQPATSNPSAPWRRTEETRTNKMQFVPKAPIAAIWSASINLSLVIIFMTSIALLNRSLDKPKTLLVNSRWIRMAPRIPLIAIICCLPLVRPLAVTEWFGITCSLMYALFVWEWIAGLERNWQLVEPKGE